MKDSGPFSDVRIGVAVACALVGIIGTVSYGSSRLSRCKLELRKTASMVQQQVGAMIS